MDRGGWRGTLILGTECGMQHMECCPLESCEMWGDNPPLLLPNNVQCNSMAAAALMNQLSSLPSSTTEFCIKGLGWKQVSLSYSDWSLCHQHSEIALSNMLYIYGKLIQGVPLILLSRLAWKWHGWIQKWTDVLSHFLQTQMKFKSYFSTLHKNFKHE